jgi:hypothetical protein
MAGAEHLQETLSDAAGGHFFFVGLGLLHLVHEGQHVLDFGVLKERFFQLILLLVEVQLALNVLQQA